MSDPDPREHLAEGSLISHLIELRDRLLRAVIAVAVLFVPCAIFSDRAVHAGGAAADQQDARGHFDDRDQPGVAVHGAAETRVPGSGVSRDARTCCTKPGRSSRQACIATKSASPFRS